MSTSLLIDAHYMLHKAEHSGFQALTYTFTRSLIATLDHFKPTYAAAVFDTYEGRQPRQAIIDRYAAFLGTDLSAYKAERSSSDEFNKSRAECMEICRAFGVHVFAPKTGEADDLIASIAYLTAPSDIRHVIYSNDRDLYPVLEYETTMFNGMATITAETVFTKYRIAAKHFTTWLALVGKPGQIPGVHGIGLIAATKLMQQFSDLATDDLPLFEAIYAHLDDVEDHRIAGLLHNGHLQARLSYALAQLDRGMKEWDGSLASLHRKPENREELLRLFQDLGFKSLYARAMQAK